VQLRVDALVGLEQALIRGPRWQVIARLEIARGHGIAITILERESQ